MSTNFPPEREALLYLILLLYNSTVELKSHVLKALKNFTYQVIYENRERKGICKLVELISWYNLIPLRTFNLFIVYPLRHA